LADRVQFAPFLPFDEANFAAFLELLPSGPAT